MPSFLNVSALFKNELTSDQNPFVKSFFLEILQSHEYFILRGLLPGKEQYLSFKIFLDKKNEILNSLKLAIKTQDPNIILSVFKNKLFPHNFNHSLDEESFIKNIFILLQVDSQNLNSSSYKNFVEIRFYEDHYMTHSHPKITNPMNSKLQFPEFFTIPTTSSALDKLTLKNKTKYKLKKKRCARIRLAKKHHKGYLKL